MATASSSRTDTLEAETSVTPANLKRALSSPSISSEPGTADPELTNAPGYRAAEAYVRPSPISTVGTISHYTFDLRKCEFTLKIQAKETGTETPTTVFLPEYHFPKNTCIVEVSSGKWEISSDDDETAMIQKFRWWHAGGEQSLKITGLIRRHNYVEGVSDEGGYYEQLNAWVGQGNCTMM